MPYRIASGSEGGASRRNSLSLLLSLFVQLKQRVFEHGFRLF
jgi:hypothetical protein